jgi:hypothetical protein
LFLGIATARPAQDASVSGRAMRTTSVLSAGGGPDPLKNDKVTGRLKTELQPPKKVATGCLSTAPNLFTFVLFGPE